MKKFISIDIDGILNNYPICWLEYVKLQTEKTFKSVPEAKIALGDIRYKEIKHLYRTSGYKATLPVNAGVAEATKLILSKGYSIVITTSRPFDKYAGLKELTHDWLIKNNISFNMLESKKVELFDKVENIQAHIDDEFEHTIMFLEKNIKVYLTTNDSMLLNSEYDQSPLIFRTVNLQQFANDLPIL